MNWRPNKWIWAIALAIAANGEALAQSRYRRVEEPQWLKFRVTQASAGVYADGVFQETTVSSGDSTTYDRIFVGPSFGLNLDGSIYHPYFLRYNINTEGSYGWAEQNVQSSNGVKNHREEFQYLGRFQGHADLFANKPFNGGFFGDYGRTYREYDFFNRATVDGSGYGARLSYSKPALSLNANYSHHEETLFDTSVPFSTQEDVFTFDARNTRGKGASSFNYTYNKFDHSGAGSLGSGVNHTFSVADDERFGSHEQIQLNSGASYSRREGEATPSDQMIANSSLGIDHRPDLRSSYDLNYDRFHTGGFVSDTYSGQAQLRHQLYESLTSTLMFEGSDLEITDDFNAGYSRRFGGGISEAYTKRLGENHRVRVSNSIIIEHLDQQGISTVKNERHIFPRPPATESFLLGLPNINEVTIVVTDAAETQRYMQGIDYEIFRNGTRIQIRRISGGGILEGATVLVDYRATPQAQGAYETMGEFFQIRFELWKNLVGIYNRVSFSLNNAPPELNALETSTYVFGADVNWRAFRAGAEYEIYNSDQSKYRSARFFQSYSFRPDDSSTLGIDLSQTFTDYVDANRQEQDYRFISHYSRGLSSHLRMGVDAGVDFRRGEGVDQTLATFRPTFDYVIGKTTIRAEYDYEYNLFLNSEERNKHLFTLRIRRVF